MRRRRRVWNVESWGPFPCNDDIFCDSYFRRAAISTFLCHLLGVQKAFRVPQVGNAPLVIQQNTRNISLDNWRHSLNIMYTVTKKHCNWRRIGTEGVISWIGGPGEKTTEWNSFVRCVSGGVLYPFFISIHPRKKINVVHLEINNRMINLIRSSSCFATHGVPISLLLYYGCCAGKRNVLVCRSTALPSLSRGCVGRKQLAIKHLSSLSTRSAHPKNFINVGLPFRSTRNLSTGDSTLSTPLLWHPHSAVPVVDRSVGDD